jgi:hypothetical protein
MPVCCSTLLATTTATNNISRYVCFTCQKVILFYYRSISTIFGFVVVVVIVVVVVRSAVESNGLQCTRGSVFLCVPLNVQSGSSRSSLSILALARGRHNMEHQLELVPPEQRETGTAAVVVAAVVVVIHAELHNATG